MTIKRTDDEIEDLLDECAEQRDRGTTKYHGQTYEDGIRNTIDWLRGDTDDGPMD